MSSVFAFFKGIRYERSYGCVKIENEVEKQCDGNHSEKRIKYALSKKRIIDCEHGYHEVDPLHLVTGLTSFASSKTLDKELFDMFIQKMQKSDEWMELFGDTLSATLLRFDKISNSLLDFKAMFSAEIRQRGEQIIREILNGIDVLLDARNFAPIPTIMIIQPINKKLWRPKSWFMNSYSLTPCCEYEKNIHKINYSFQFEAPQDWWRKAAPIISSAINVLTIAGRIGLAFVGVPSSMNTSPGYDLVNEEIHCMQEILKTIPKLDGDINSNVPIGTQNVINQFERTNKLSGILNEHYIIDDYHREAMMALTNLYKNNCLSEFEARKYGDLERVRLPDNTYRWLCKEHRNLLIE